MFINSKLFHLLTIFIIFELLYSQISTGFRTVTRQVSLLQSGDVVAVYAALVSFSRSFFVAVSYPQGVFGNQTEKPHSCGKKGNIAAFQTPMVLVFSFSHHLL